MVLKSIGDYVRFERTSGGWGRVLASESYDISFFLTRFSACGIHVAYNAANHV